ncbi:hypothetical protein AKH15_07130 [Vibrio parahaemolyticus]|uniref:hypothetical protein n=1 Tax=Vibrio harveyi group TaxID=717610 RepID=UPI0008132AF8|nr:hypothetical protein [Vibrio parahaemolyticus]MCA0934009.1 hypothetical protein [Vibrio alginolyticus]OCQ02087.1 hypothetical protein AKH15_07130 [Vibrio parahaemolyticus]
MKHYLVKHIVKDHGPVTKVYKEIEHRYYGVPYAMTKKEKESLEAANGSKIWVVEVENNKGSTNYYLAYSFHCTEVRKPAFRAYPEGYTRQLTVDPDRDIQGSYFPKPVLIENKAIQAILASYTYGFELLRNEAITYFNELTAKHGETLVDFERKY